jgi:hypothetical protein
MAVITPKEIDDFSTLSNTIEINSGISGSFGYSSIDYGAIPTVSISDTLTLGNISFANTTAPTYTLGAQGSQSNAVWTTSGTGYNWSGTGTNIGTTIGQSGKVSLNGKDADVEINGKSLKTWMEQVEERLNMLTPNPELEKEWDELRKLGERYRKLEKKCKEKSEVWKKLKSMPPPNLG